MPVWHLTINLTDLHEAHRMGRASIEETAKKVVERIRESGWRKITPYPDTFDDTLGDLENSTTVAWYDAVMNELYDLADSDRVWIETTG